MIRGLIHGIDFLRAPIETYATISAMHRPVLAIALACTACGHSSSGSDPADQPPMLDDHAVPGLVQARLAELRATTTGELLGDGSPRALGAGVVATLPGSNGRAGYVVIVLKAGALPVPTELGLRMNLAVDSTGATRVSEVPTRADLVTATRLAVDTEQGAFAAAMHAQERAGHHPPSTWQAALRTLRLDPRLPAGAFYGEPTWQLIFDPWDEARGGYRSVVLSAPALAVLDVR